MRVALPRFVLLAVLLGAALPAVVAAQASAAPGAAPNPRSSTQAPATAPQASAAATSAPSPAEAPPTFRLPVGTRPLGYAVTMTVVPGQPRVQATIDIDVELDAPRAVLWLNADQLEVKNVATDAPGTRVAVLDSPEQFVGLAFEPALAAGRHRVSIAYEAAQSVNSTRGVFALQEGGAWYAMTQFEPLAARRAFPCFDEPAYKAPWQLTLRVPRDLVAVSNTKVVSKVDAADGFTEVRFAPTRPLPSYLVAFAVGPWETVDVGTRGANATPMRIVVPRGRRDEARFVARAYPELFDYLEGWFGIPYPFDKLDHIAIPLGVGFAMENAGLITYGTSGLLARPDGETPRFRRGAASTGAHEMAHQWFGNLVTTAWWDDLWLNEAFATWIAVKAVDAWRPDYERGAARVGERAEAIGQDLLASARQIRAARSPARGDINGAFDSHHLPEGRVGHRDVRGLARRGAVSPRRPRLPCGARGRLRDLGRFPVGAVRARATARSHPRSRPSSIRTGCRG